MTAAELIEQLKYFPADSPVTLYAKEGWNAVACPVTEVQEMRVDGVVDHAEIIGEV